MFSLTADYALRAVLMLALEAEGAAVRVDAIADAIGAPRNYLAKTMNALAKAGIVTSTRGPLGGFSLAIAPANLAVTSVTDVFDEPPCQQTCLLGRQPCNPAQPCAAHARWSRVTRHAREALSSLSVADLLCDAAR